MSEPVPQLVGVRVDWSDIDACPTQHVNQVIVQLGNAQAGIPDGIYIGLGNIPPPLVLAADEKERVEIITALAARAAKVSAHGRFHMSRGVLTAVIKALQTAADQYDEYVQRAADAPTSEDEMPQ
jgi:hypothetical protein